MFKLLLQSIQNLALLINFTVKIFIYYMLSLYPQGGTKSLQLMIAKNNGFIFKRKKKRNTMLPR